MNLVRGLVRSLSPSSARADADVRATDDSASQIPAASAWPSIHATDNWTVNTPFGQMPVGPARTAPMQNPGLLGVPDVNPPVAGTQAQHYYLSGQAAPTTLSPPPVATTMAFARHGETHDRESRRTDTNIIPQGMVSAVLRQRSTSYPRRSDPPSLLDSPLPKRFNLGEPGQTVPMVPHIFPRLPEE